MNAYYFAAIVFFLVAVLMLALLKFYVMFGFAMVTLTLYFIGRSKELEAIEAEREAKLKARKVR